MAAVILGAHAIVPRPSEGRWAFVDRAGRVDLAGTYRGGLADASVLGDGTREAWR